MRYGSPVAAYLAQARQIDGLIQAKLEQIAQLRASITRGTAMLSDMPRGGPLRDAEGKIPMYETKDGLREYTICEKCRKRAREYEKKRRK